MKKIVEWIASQSLGLDSVVKGWDQRRTLKVEHQLDLDNKNHELKKARIDARIARFTRTHDADADYDAKVIEAKRFTLADEFLILTYTLIFVCHFIPFTQPYMAEGWRAMGYNGVPWWMEFAMVGILVSTLGLMRIFRMFWLRKDTVKPSKTSTVNEAADDQR